MPGGVESQGRETMIAEFGKFLMCRVELKGHIFAIAEIIAGQVPNVPGGVERRCKLILHIW